MKVNAICMVKNEADIIIEALENALSFCNKIYVFDNGSTDGTSELLDDFIKDNPSVILTERSDEVFRNELRNRVYNRYHQEFEHEDWWYILDADELLASDPRPMLRMAAENNCDSMRIWQAQFYFTDKDMSVYDQEDHNLPTSERRRYYRINWREPRFFKNNPDMNWDESITGKVPPFCGRFYYRSPICRHYAQRTPEQIEQRVKIRIANPYSFLHLKKGDALAQASWLKRSEDLFYYHNDGEFEFPMSDKISYFVREAGYWLQWRFKWMTNHTKNLMKTMMA